MGKHFLIALTLLCFTACTTLQPLPDAQPATIRQAVKPGDNIELEKTDGTRLVLKVEEVGDDFLQGTDNASRHRVPYADIRSLGARVMTTSDKTWTAVAVGAAVAAVIAVAGGGSGGGGSSDGPGY